jgi:hypothetical protein
MVGGIAMNGMRIHSLGVLLCLGFVFGCEKAPTQPRVAGIVRSHVDTYLSSTGTSSDLVRDNHMVGGFHYGDGKKPDWKSTIRWELTGHRGESDVYQFKWEFSPVGGNPVSSEREVEYDGKKPVIVFQNGSETVSIEPGSIPLPRNF